MKFLTTIALLVVACMQSITMNAQVMWKDRSICIADGHQIHHSICRPANSSYTIVVWQDGRAGAPGVYAQKIDSETGLAEWPDIDGVPVCTYDGTAAEPCAAYDSQGGVIVAWLDQRSATAVVYAQRIILSSGTIDQTWTADGIQISENAGGPASHLRLVGMENGVYLVWEKDNQIYIQCLTNTGALPNNWPLYGLLCGSGGYVDHAPEVALDRMTINGHTGAVIAYQSNSSGYDQIWLEDFTYGAALNWGPTTADPNPQSAVQQNVQLITTTRTLCPSYFLVWEDNRQNGQWTTYCSGVYTNGTKAYNDAAPLSGNSIEQKNPKITFMGNGDSFVATAWEEGYTGIYANIFSTSNAPPNVANAFMVCDTDNVQKNVAIESYTDGGAYHSIICWDDQRNGINSEIFYQDVKLIGGIPTPLFPTARLVAETKWSEALPAMGDKVFVWTDGRRLPIDYDSQQDRNIFCQKIGDACDAPTFMNWKGVYGRWSLSSNARNHKFVVGDIGKTAYLVWDEKRVLNANGDTVHGVYIQKLDRDGMPRWKNNGILLSDANATAINPDVCIDRKIDPYTGDITENGAYVIFRQRSQGGSTYSAIVKHVESDGAISWSYSPNSSGNENYPVIVERDYDVATYPPEFGAWYAFVSTVGGVDDCKFGCVKSDGSSLLSPTSATFPDPLYDTRIIKDMVGEAYIFNRGGGNIYAAHIGASGLPQPGTQSNVYLSDAAFPGYDVVINPVRNTYIDNPKYAALIVVVDDIVPNCSNIVAEVFCSINNAWDFYGTKALTTNATNSNIYEKNPAIDADNDNGYAINGTTYDGGGAIVAWDHQVGQTHNVNTTDVVWTRALVSATECTLPISTDMYNQYINSVETHPKIAKLQHINPQPASSHVGIITWGTGENAFSCLPSGSAVLCQWVDYGLPGGCAQLIPVPQPVNPGSSSCSQINPLIKTYDYSDHAFIFWMEDRSGCNGIVGSRVYPDISDQVIGIDKRNGRSNDSRNEGMTLYQSYPNPFNAGNGGETAIHFKLAEGGFVTIKLYNSIGREISTIHAGELGQGEHSIPFDARSAGLGMPEGMYFYILTCGSSRVVGKMTIIK